MQFTAISNAHRVKRRTDVGVCTIPLCCESDRAYCMVQYMVQYSPDLVAVCDLRQKTIVCGSNETLSQFRGDVILGQQTASTSGTTAQRALAFLYCLNAPGTLAILLQLDKLRVAYNNAYKRIL